MTSAASSPSNSTNSSAPGSPSRMAPSARELELAAREVEDGAVDQLDRGRVLRHGVVGRGDRLGRRGEVTDGRSPGVRPRHQRDLASVTIASVPSRSDDEPAPG